MKTEMLISTCILAALFFLAIGATEANTFAVQVLCTSSAVALFFYHLHRGNIGFSIDRALAQKSIVIGAILAVPLSTI